MASSDEESIPQMEEGEYSETTTPVPVATTNDQAGDAHFSGEIGVKGELYLSVDKDEYRAGDLVTGRITVLVSEPLQCGALVCTIVGEEIAQWRNGGDHHSRCHQILRQEVVHKDLPNPYDIGEYIYPLTYTLPADLPGVLNVQPLDGDVSALHATIKYTVTATIKVQGRFVSDLEASTDVVVRSSAQPVEFHSVERTVSKVLRWFGCLSRGTSHLAMSMPRDVFTLGESPIVECFVNNHTASVGVEQVRVQLIQKVTMRHPDGQEDACTRPVAEAKCPGPKHELSYL
ncbi:Arrestin domain-containing protein A [Phytophthora cinnamomi]|uniref:Arrestin domain-containing protein A n=1 Tax=Phytophthora cinnamomi TaxID=4785 RepID=UPI00355A1547|nr:Arrestin domain-containing protein A [Phytophthora cinnamomi]